MKSKFLNFCEKNGFALFALFWAINIILSIPFKFKFYLTGNYLHYTYISDMIFLMIMLGYLSFKGKYKVLIFFGLLFIFKITGSFSISAQYPDTFRLFKEIVKTTVGYGYIFILFTFLQSLPYKRASSLQLPKKTFLYAIILIGVSILVGLITQAYILRTYDSTKRFGISGLLFPSSYTSYFYGIALTTLYVLKKHFHQEKIYPIVLYSLGVLALLSGTKTAYLFLLWFFLWYFIEKKYYRRGWWWMGLAAGLGLLVLFREKLADVFITLVKLYENHNFLTFALSYRNVSAHSTFRFVNEHWTWLNYLIGGLNNKLQLTQLGLLDIGLNFGILGGLIFIFGYYRLILSRLKWSSFLLLMGAGLLMLIALGGNFFDRIYLAYWLAFLFMVQQRLFPEKASA